MTPPTASLATPTWRAVIALALLALPACRRRATRPPAPSPARPARDAGALARPAPAPPPPLPPSPRALALFGGGGRTCARLEGGALRCWGLDPMAFAFDTPGSGTPRDTPALAAFDALAFADATGRGYGCGIRAGAVSCWGTNADGQLGDGTTRARSTPAPVAGLTSVRSIALYWTHACALHDDGGVSCWGHMDHDPIGNAARTRPRRVPGLGGVVQIAVGGYRACAALADGGLRCWGDNEGGRIVVGGAESYATPQAVDVNGPVRRVAVAAQHSCALRADGAVVCWGNRGMGPVVGLPPAVDLVAISGFEFVALHADGTASMWTTTRGNGGNEPPSGHTPVRRIAGLSAVREVVGSMASVCGLDRDGRVACAGDNRVGELAQGTVAQERPVAVAVVGLTDARAVRAFARSTCAVSATRGLLCWGEAPFYEGRPSTPDTATPTAVEGGAAAVDCGLGWEFGCARLRTGQIACFGSNDIGALGTAAGGGSVTAQLIPGVHDARQLSVGRGFACALIADGTVRCWGATESVQDLVLPQTDRPNGGTFALPAPVPGIAGADAMMASDSQLCARARGGWSCLGTWNLSMGESALPPSLPAPIVASFASASASAIALGPRANCAIWQGAVRCWGDNAQGQLGTGDLRPRWTPTPVRLEGGPATYVAVGGTSACAVMADGTVRCWGDNEYGQAGGPASRRAVTTPRAIAGVANAAYVAVGEQHACALLRDGAVRCWGNDQSGQLGDGVLLDSDAALPVRW